jgi:hypothetical protein
MHISEKLGKKYTAITVDQALYFKLMDLKWSVPRYKEMQTISNSMLPSRHLRGMNNIFSIKSGVIYVNIVSPTNMVNFHPGFKQV